MNKKKSVWCVIAIVLGVLLTGMIVCYIKGGRKPEEKGYLIKQMEEDQNVSRA